MRALFVTNQLKTVFYAAVARRMREGGAEIFWISTSRRWTRYLLELGWSAGSILSLPDFGAEWSGGFTPSAEDEARVRRIETSAEIGLRNAAIMDRGLRERDGVYARNYVYVVTREIERFVEQNGVGVGFGEITWAPELITSEVLRARGGRFFMPHTIRVPSTRVALFEGVYHNKIARMRAVSGADRDIAVAAIAAVREKGQKPYYFAQNMNPYRFRSHWWREAREAIFRAGESQYDHSVPSLGARAMSRLKGRVNGIAAKFGSTFEPPPQAAQKPYILVPLHRQPESSVDVLGAPFCHQLESIRALARIAPFGWEVWVKEHGHALGDRDAGFYRELKALPGARLIDPGADTARLIKGAGLVASATGTACLEAALMGAPAVTFGALVWAPILLRSSFDPFSANVQQMAALLEEGAALRRDPAHAGKCEAFIADMVAQSIEAVVGDPVNSPECMAKKNVDAVALFCLRVLPGHEPGNAPERAVDSGAGMIFAVAG